MKLGRKIDDFGVRGGSHQHLKLVCHLVAVVLFHLESAYLSHLTMHISLVVDIGGATMAFNLHLVQEGRDLKIALLLLPLLLRVKLLQSQVSLLPVLNGLGSVEHRLYRYLRLHSRLRDLRQGHGLRDRYRNRYI